MWRVFPIGFPCKNGGWFVLGNLELESCALVFPRLDVQEECQLALAWLLANPRRQKTEQGMPRFLNAWLARSAHPAAYNRQVDQDRRRGPSAPRGCDHVLDRARYMVQATKR